MEGSREKAIQKEIEKAVDWYCETYKKSGNQIEVHQRYDKDTKHFSWRVIVKFKKDEYIIPFGVSEAMLEHPNFFRIKARVFPWLKSLLVKAQRQYEPIWLPTVYGPEKV